MHIKNDEKDEWSEELLKAVLKRTKSSKVRERMRDLTSVDEAISEEDHHQEILLLTLILKKQYSYSVGGLLSPVFLAKLRRAFGRDLLDALAKWEVHLFRGDRRKVRRAFVYELDPEIDRSPDQAEDRRFRYGSVIPSPEREYEISLAVGRLEKGLSPTAAVKAFLRDLLANADLAEHAREGLEVYRSRYREYDRIPAKAMADVHGLSEHHRKEVLRKVTEFLKGEGISKGESLAYLKKHGRKRRPRGATPRHIKRMNRNLRAGSCAGPSQNGSGKTH